MMTPNSDPPEDDFAGRQFGASRIIQPIGKGGMGSIYLAEDCRLERRVALKLLPAAGLSSPARVQRFQQEARAASALNHPNIITIYDFGQDGDVYYIAAELVQGKTLRELMAGGKTPPREVLEIAIQITSALAAAHAAGIVHRDIKPDNIMVRGDGYVKVLDFGLAKLREPGSSETVQPDLTSPGAVLGTARYMSPEQARGVKTDARTDLFSLGAVLYELLAHRPPFAGETAADLITAILGQEPPPLPHLPPAFHQLESIVRKCLRKDREHRYQTAQDLLADLRQVQADSQTAGRPTSNLARSRRTRFLWLAAAAAILLSAAAWIYLARFHSDSWYQNSRLTRIPGSDLFSTGVLSADGQYIAYVRMSPDGNRSLNLRFLAAPRAIELVPAALVAYNALAFSADGTYLYYVSRPVKPGVPFALYRIPVLGGRGQKLADDVSGKIAVAPDGQSLALVRRRDGEGTLSILPADGTGERELLRRRADYPFQTIEWAPGSREIFFVETQGSVDADCRIFAVRREGGPPRLVANPKRTFVYDLAALPDGSGFLANAFDRDANLQQIWHVARDGAMRHITHDLSQYQGLSVSRDGRQILTSQVERRSELWVLDRDNPASAHIVTEPGRRYDSPTWARDGSIIASRFEAGNWMLWDIPPGGGERPLLAQSGSDLTPNACPDRDDIVFSSGRKGPYAIWQVLPDGNGLKQLTPGANDRFPQCVAGGTVLYWLETGTQRTGMQVSLEGGQPSSSGQLTSNQLVSPDGRLVLSPYTDDKSHEHRIAVRTRDLATTIATYPFGGRASATAWAPDSQGFADARGKGLAQEIWYQAIAGGPPKQLTHFGSDAVFDVSWSPDGRQLVCSRVRFVSDLVLIRDGR